MNTKLTAILASGILLFVAAANAQTTLRGKVVDADHGLAIEYATITVAERASGKVIDGAMTDSTGAFTIAGIQEGLYKISCNSVGYDTYTMDSLQLLQANQQLELPALMLQNKGRSLQGITVTHAAPVIENKIDKIVYNAANDVTGQGGVALDILKKVPQVSVDADGNVELQGSSNIRFLINGKPSSIFGNSLADALASIPASQIKSIEAITSPGARDDAQGTGGIINIILKENKMQGLNGSVHVSGGTRMENASVNLGARWGKFGVNAFFSGNAALNAQSPNSQDRSSYNPADRTMTSLLQNGSGAVQRQGYQSGISFDWDLSKADQLSGSFQSDLFSSQRDGFTNLQQTVTDAAGNILSNAGSIRNSGNNTSTRSFDWSLDYRHKFRHEGEEIDVNCNASYGRPILQYSQLQAYDIAGNPYAGSSSYNPGRDNQMNIAVNYTYPVNSKTTLEAGAKTNFNSISSLTDVRILAPASGEYLYDALQSYSMHYKMNIYAGYVSASFSMFRFLDVKAGLRVEHTDIAIDYGNTHIPSYNTYVPSISFSHKIGADQFVKLNYAHRIERPDYEELNPFLNLSDPYNITTGNPLLQPEIGDNFELGYNKSFKNGANLYVALTERINSHDIKPYTLFYPNYQAGDSTYNNVSVSTRVNIGMEYNTGLIVTGAAPILRNLNVRGNLMVFNRHIINNLDSGNRITNGINWRLNMNISYQLPHNLMLEAFGNYKSAFNNIQGRNPQFFTYTFAFRKQFRNKNASIGITATNFLNNFVKQVTTIHTDSYDAYNIREIPLRSFGITFTYKFGKLDFKDKKKDSNFTDMQGDN